ncbi:exo 1,3/1,4-beta-D-glucan glucohydrolase [Algimonas porphyrae]|uniref:Glucan 1,4-beta-glucosidase n=1 Tax=Algimonas porphyrae TaxID=1128113 RepID=A0ABQ5V1H6_9PROT|nr:exo 1,3/1,4-beta-D-glucan glucohydrolase [Algimonas porphyrae]GLQ21409.1 glucan 1,4-beta-glucosidase [Algimonas porphyrae]
MYKYSLLLGAAVCFGLSACAETTPVSTVSAIEMAGADTSVESRAARILAAMTVEEKVGQVIQADIASITPEEVGQYNLGSVLNGGNSAPGGGKVADPQAWVDLADAFWTASTDTTDGGLGIPAIWGTDAVHGHNNLQTATIFPHNSALGAANDPDLMREIGDVTAREIRATGIDWTFAPTLAVALDDRWGRAYESYSENPAIVASFAGPLVEGLQGLQGEDDFMIGENVMATAKHFIGDGGTQLGIDKGDTVGDLKTILDIHGAGYGPAIAAGVQSVMSSFSSVNGEKMHGSRQFLNDILRGEMGFDGFVVGDWNGHAEVPGCTATDCPEALMAGIDMYMAPDSWRGLYESLLDQVGSGEVPMARLDEAVTRILEVKIRSGLLAAGLPSERAATDVSLLGSADHRDVARRAVRQSLVLLKHENDVLPLQPGTNVLISGSGADSMEQQTGGWTLNWQGTGNANEEFLTGETIASGLTDAIEAIGGTATLSEDGTFDTAPDVAIVVFGEQPYAEYKGDVSDLVYEFEGGENLALLRSLQTQGIPVVAVFLTGRPLFMNAHINASDAFVVGWLPGSEGGGVADVLVADSAGEMRHDFTGRLSFSWPDNGVGEPINAADDPGVLFPFGYGLAYGDDGELSGLTEDPGVAATGQSFNGAILSRGDTAAGFQVYVGDSSNLNTPINGLAGESLGGAVTVAGVDYRAQEDARRIAWSGNGEGAFRLASGRSVDLSAFEDQILRLTWRIDQPPEGEVTLGMSCGEGCQGAVDISEALNTAPLNEWTETDVPVSCLVDAGLALENVQNALAITTASAAQISLHDVRFAQGDGSASCP